MRHPSFHERDGMPSARRILFLENGVSGGGSFTGLLQIVANLDRRAYDPVVVFVNGTPFVDQVRNAGVTAMVLRDPLYSNASAATMRRMTGYARAAAHRSGAAVPWMERCVHRPSMRALIACMRAMDIALLHCNDNPIRDYYGIAAARQSGIPCVSHIRSMRIGDASPRLMPEIVAGVTRFVANSRYAAEFWVERVGLPVSRMTVIPNAVSLDTPEPSNLRRWWVGDRREPVIGCVANFTDGKGHEFLLESFGDVVRLLPHAGLLFVGDGPRRPSVERRVRELALTASVAFAGYDDRARAIMAACDVLVVPSATEAFGRTVLEAMAIGTPVVATRVGGIPELVVHGENGLLVEYGDTDAMTHAIIRLVRDADLAQRCVVAGRRTAAQWSVERHVQAISALYEEVFTSRVPARAVRV